MRTLPQAQGVIYHLALRLSTIMGRTKQDRYNMKVHQNGCALQGSTPQEKLNGGHADQTQDLVNGGNKQRFLKEGRKMSRNEHNELPSTTIFNARALNLELNGRTNSRPQRSTTANTRTTSVGAHNDKRGNMTPQAQRTKHRLAYTGHTSTIYTPNEHTSKRRG